MGKHSERLRSRQETEELSEDLQQLKRGAEWQARIPLASKPLQSCFLKHLL